MLALLQAVSNIKVLHRASGIFIALCSLTKNQAMNPNDYDDEDNVLLTNKILSALAVILFLICAGFVSYAFVVTLIE